MSIFRYFGKEEYATALIEQGQMLFRPLAYFRNLEGDAARGDPHDGKLRHSPAAGLEITKSDGSVINLPGCHFTSSTKENEIFICCFSNEFSEAIAAKFESPFCVEIENPDIIARRLNMRVSRASKLDYSNIFFGDVEYRALEAEPGADWALPEKLAFIKPPEFADQKEFRFVMGKRGVFEPENVECTLVDGSNKAALNTALDTKLTVDLGNLGNKAKLHRF
jgi:hypothetical protein